MTISMKKLSIILICALVAIAACTKSKEVHPELGDGNDEIVTVGMRDVHVEYTRTDHAELSRVVFHCCPADANGNAQQFVAAAMTKKETFFELTLNDLLSDTLYWYYYELFPNSGNAVTTIQKTFHTQAFEQPGPPTPPTPPIDTPEGAINGLFTINENGDKVYFSQGNLQYQASTNTWRFAEHQWDFVGTQIPDPVLGIMGGTVSGSDNYNISSTYDGWIDLYGWGTSGWDSGNIYYHPWDTTWSIDNCHDFYGPYGNHNLTGLYAHADWGVHNSISNGGNTAETWRTLKKEEWRYLFNDRNTPSGIRFARANVCGINGLVLVPDNWSEDIFVLNNVNSSGYNHFSDNLITESQWMLLEDAGVLFLPAAGSRGDADPFPGFVILNAGNQGHYWSSSNYGNEAAYLISFGEYWVETYYGLVRSYGFSVRLVQDASK